MNAIIIIIVEIWFMDVVQVYFGAGPDLYLPNGCLTSSNSSISQSSFDYKGRSYALNGSSSSFQVEDYEVYELVLE